jgi:hypothetical protein
MGTLHQGADYTIQSYLNYKDYRDRNNVFSSLMSYRFAPMSVSHDNRNERVWGYLVSGNYFDTIGIQPFLGRYFLPEEDRTPDSNPVAVITYACWQKALCFGPKRRRPTVTNQQPAVHNHWSHAGRIQRD